MVQEVLDLPWVDLFWFSLKVSSAWAVSIFIIVFGFKIIEAILNR